MIDSAMLARFIAQVGTDKLDKVNELLPLARLIWDTAQAHERAEYERLHKEKNCVINHTQ